MANKKNKDNDNIIKAIPHKPQVPENQIQQLLQLNYIPNKEWHKELDMYLRRNPDNRKIRWYVDEEGNKEKTLYAKYKHSTDPKNVFISKNINVNEIKSAIKNGWNRKICIFDLNRTVENNKNLYAALEQIKDGIIPDSKSPNNVVMFDTPHVIVFSNWAPKQKYLSVDRLDIINL